MADAVPVSPPPVVIIMGVSGAGKTTVATALAQHSGAALIEGDDCHDAASRARMSAGIPLDGADRWPWLDRIVAAIAAARHESPVIATCSALRCSYRDHLRQRVIAPLRFVFLDPDRALLAARVAQRASHFMPPALLASQIATLEPPVDEGDVLWLRGSEPLDAILADWRGAGRGGVDWGVTPADRAGIR